jgi:nicotinate-nucleotide--dimethylbenzimidazole phosphoribosyltransferase
LAGRGLGRLADLAAWLAAVTGSERPALHARTLVTHPQAGDAGRGELTVPEVAAAVDQGRDLAAAARRDGMTVLAVGATGEASAAAASDLAALLRESPPLRALRRAGTREVAVVCGLALGAGEHGLGCVCDGPGATAGAAVAVGVEPGVRARLLVADRAPAPAHGALLEHLGLEPVLALGTSAGDGTGAAAALALLRLAADLLA